MFLEDQYNVHFKQRKGMKHLKFSSVFQSCLIILLQLSLANQRIKIVWQ